MTDDTAAVPAAAVATRARAATSEPSRPPTADAEGGREAPSGFGDGSARDGGGARHHVGARAASSPAAAEPRGPAKNLVNARGALVRAPSERPEDRLSPAEVLEIHAEAPAPSRRTSRRGETERRRRSPRDSPPESRESPRDDDSRASAPRRGARHDDDDDEYMGWPDARQRSRGHEERKDRS